MKALLFVSFAVSFHLGCASHESGTPASAPKVVEQSSASDDKALCIAVLTRSRVCTDDYIPALVDSRAKLDKPAGIAAEVKADRNAVIAAAKQEWAEDSKDDKIAANCEHMVAGMTEGDHQDSATARDCISKDCAAFTACVMPLFEKHLAK
jgi:hypothetical protein